MFKYSKFLAVLCLGLISLLGYVETASAKQQAVTAIDIALEPDATMIQHAKEVNTLPA